MEQPPYYATLGLDYGCSAEAIRTAFRRLSKLYHPDLNGSDPESLARTQALNEAYAVLSDPARRAAYDQAWVRLKGRSETLRARGRQPALRRDVRISIRELVEGTALTVRVGTPALAVEGESHTVIIPAGAAPGTRIRIPRGERPPITVRLLVKPDRTFKAKGYDLRCDLRISAQRAATGGPVRMRGALGQVLTVNIPAQVERGTHVRLVGEGLPKPHGGRGDLLVRILYRPEIRILRGPTNR